MAVFFLLVQFVSVLLLSVILPLLLTLIGCVMMVALWSAYPAYLVLGLVWPDVWDGREYLWDYSVILIGSLPF